MIDHSNFFTDALVYFFGCLVPLFFILAVYAPIAPEKFSKIAKNRFALCVIFLLLAIVSLGLANLFIPRGFP
ncbi:hypothetical protein [Acinetobacter sp. ESBL14]|uniref:hypothetical protein n=1 Tax=Acinetobacter sp. ESBL14 TaxID=3077329 RepID=UPI002FCB235A